MEEQEAEGHIGIKGGGQEQSQHCPTWYSHHAPN